MADQIQATLPRMLPSDWDLVQSVFDQACELAPEARGRFVDSSCLEKPLIREQVLLLLRSEGEVGQFLAGSSSIGDGSSGDASAPGAPPEDIGRYRLLRIIGEGGFGTVYEAMQEEPIRRLVAVKVIKAGMDSRAVIARFEAERQALALMDHPNIARVIDAGQTPAGRPYFVMELVAGEPMTRYCETHLPGAPQRLELFITVCQAVQHAHQKGIIHRDLKPSNVLVSLQDGKAVAKVIDFGIAKATQARLTERTIFTDTRQMMGTPQYMSPDQARSMELDIDTRSDIYALGVVLYELLTGTTPLDAADLRKQSYDEIRRMICEVDPPPPSARLLALEESALPQDRRTELRQLHRITRGDLDWVVMKCLEKDRARRYDSATALAADLSSYLADEPVSAARPSRLYKARKYVRRHRFAVAAVSLIAVSVITGAVLSTIGFVRANQQRHLALVQSAEADHQRAQAQLSGQKAKNQAAIASAVNAFVRQMLENASPRKSLGRNVTVLQAVTAAAATLDQGSLNDQPLVEAAVRETIGLTMENLGEYSPAEHQFLLALDLERKFAPAADDPDLIAVTDDLGSIYAAQGRLKDSQALLQTTYAREKTVLAPNNPELINIMTNLGLVLEQQGQLKEAQSFFETALAQARTLAPHDAAIAQQINNLADCYSNEGNLPAAESLFREALAVQRAHLAPNHPDLAIVLDNLGTLLERQGRPADAEPMHREALRISRIALPPGDADIASHLYSLARCLVAQQKFAEAASLYREALDVCRNAWPQGNTHIAMILVAQSNLLLAQGNLPQAEKDAQEAVQIYQKLSPPGDSATASAQRLLAHIQAQSHAAK